MFHIYQSTHSFLILEAKQFDVRTGPGSLAVGVCSMEGISGEDKVNIDKEPKGPNGRGVIYFIAEATSRRTMAGLGVRNLELPGTEVEYMRGREMTEKRRCWYSWQEPHEEELLGF